MPDLTEERTNDQLRSYSVRSPAAFVVGFSSGRKTVCRPARHFRRETEGEKILGRRWEFVLTKTITKRIREASDPRTAETSEICMAAATEQAGRRPAEGGCKATAGRGDFPLKKRFDRPGRYRYGYYIGGCSYQYSYNITFSSKTVNRKKHSSVWTNANMHCGPMALALRPSPP